MNTLFEKRICLTICISQLLTVLSCMGIVYLTVAVYVSSYRLLHSGFSEQTVMCTTVSNTTVPNCEISGEPIPSWSSCGEWCLSKSSGSCTQIRVDVRHNGSNIRLEGCSNDHTIYCNGFDPNMKFYECITGECGTLHGIFNCTQDIDPATGDMYGARCRNLTSVLSCNLTTTDPAVVCNSKKACLHLDGLYECDYGSCARVHPPFQCEKRCIGIRTGGKDVVIRQGDVIFTANCDKAVDIDENPPDGTEIWPNDLKSLSVPEDRPTLIMFCTTLRGDPEDKKTFMLTDCFNGSLLEPGHFGNTTNITYLVQSHYDSERILDENRKFAPPEIDLLIYNSTRLLINFDGCINSENVCAKFHLEYGRVGNDLRAQSRFQCYYQPDSSEYVTVHFSRLKNIEEPIITSTIQITLAVVCCFNFICFILYYTRTIHAGNNSHSRCGADATAALEQEAIGATALELHTQTHEN